MWPRIALAIMTEPSRLIWIASTHFVQSTNSRGPIGPWMPALLTSTSNATQLADRPFDKRLAVGFRGNIEFATNNTAVRPHVRQPANLGIQKGLVTGANGDISPSRDEAARNFETQPSIAASYDRLTSSKNTRHGETWVSRPAAAPARIKSARPGSYRAGSQRSSALTTDELSSRPMIACPPDVKACRRHGAKMPEPVHAHAHHSLASRSQRLSRR